MTIVRAPEKDWTKDGRKYYFVVSYKNAQKVENKNVQNIYSVLYRFRYL